VSAAGCVVSAAGWVVVPELDDEHPHNVSDNKREKTNAVQINVLFILTSLQH
jgi:hypothetical protein